MDYSKQFSLQGKTAFVSGMDCPKSIAAEISRCFLQQGAKVICSGLNQEKGLQTLDALSELSPQVRYLELDVTSEADWEAVVKNIKNHEGQLDVVVNAAGVLLLKPLAKMSLEEWRSVYRVNVDGMFLAIRSLLPLMASPSSVINIASVAAGQTALEHAAYGSSKAAVVNLTRQLALECAGRNIRVNAISPGVVQTSMLIQTPENLKRVKEAHLLGLGKPSDIASAALYLASPASRWVTGSEMIVDGGLSIKP